MAKTRRSEPDRKRQARCVVAALTAEYPETACALVHADPYQLIVATILSAQCTDARVNMVTPELFRRYPDASHLARAEPAELESLIRSTGFFRAKARNLLAMAQQVAERHDGRIPEDLESLTALSGVGRKTANVVLGVAFGTAEGVVVEHPRQTACRAPRPVHRQDTRPDRAAVDERDTPHRVGGPEPSAHPARPARLPGPPAEMRILLARRDLPEDRRGSCAHASRQGPAPPAIQRTGRRIAVHLKSGLPLRTAIVYPGV